MVYKLFLNIKIIDIGLKHQARNFIMLLGKKSKLSLVKHGFCLTVSAAGCGANSIGRDQRSLLYLQKTPKSLLFEAKVKYGVL